MAKDFTLKSYQSLLEALVAAGYSTLDASSGAADVTGRLAVLRHDVDKRPDRSLATAEIEAAMGLRAVYYFRAVPCSLDEDIIRRIASLGHAIGYHYESLTTCNGDIDAAWKDFRANLETLRTIAAVSTICVHGSFISRWDSRDLWSRYDYRTLGIDGVPSMGVPAEPYMDTDWSQTFYLTDTGRRWDGFNVSLRDKIPHWQDEWSKQGLVFHSTFDIIDALAKGRLPDRIMFTTHPQRWTDSSAGWLRELCLQNLKNIVKAARVALSDVKAHRNGQ